MKTTQTALEKLPDRTVILCGDAAAGAGCNYYTAMKVITVFHRLLFSYLCRNFEVRLFDFLKVFYSCRIAPKKDRRYGEFTHPYYPERFIFVSTQVKEPLYQCSLTMDSFVLARKAALYGMKHGGENEIIHKIIRYHDFRTFNTGCSSLRGRDRRRRHTAARLSYQKAPVENR